MFSLGFTIGGNEECERIEGLCAEVFVRFVAISSLWKRNLMIEESEFGEFENLFSSFS